MSRDETIVASVRRLPTSHKDPLRYRKREIQWITSHRSLYAGQWVVVEGDRLIAADPDGQKAFLEAKAAGVEVPFLIHVRAEEALPFVACW